MDCSCIKGKLDFSILEVSNNKFTMTDISDWMLGGRYSVPQTFEVEVIPPSSTSGAMVNAIPYQSVTVDDSTVSIKDGVYTFKTTSCGVEFSVFKLVIPKMRCCLDQAWATVEDKFYPNLEEVERYLRATNIAVEFNQVSEAYSNFKIAKQLFDNVKCDCSC